MGLVADVIVYSIVLMVHILMMENYKDCKLPMDLAMVILFSAVIWSRVFFHLYKLGYYPVVTLPSLVLGIVTAVAMIISGLVFMILIEIFHPKCMPLNLKVLDWIIVGGGNGMTVLAVVVVILLFIQYRQEQMRAKKTLEKVHEVYEKIYDPKFDADKFIEEHQATIDLEKLSPVEMAIFREQCCMQFPRDQSGIPESEKKDCSICLVVFEEGQPCVRHPVCKHTFHEGCFLPWLKDALYCPMCKRGFRSSLIKELHRKTLGLSSPNSKGSISSNQSCLTSEGGNQSL